MSDRSTLLLPPVPGGPPGPDAEPPPPRHRWRVVLIVAAAVVVLAIPLALFFVLRGGSNSPIANPTPTGGPTATASAPTSPAPTATATGEPAPDGRISLAELKNATLDIPPWPADNLTGVSGRLKFVDGQVVSPPDATFPFERHIIIFETTYGDVDRDGAQETLALIGCWVQGGSDQLVAFDRDREGHIVTLGTVVATTGEVRAIESATVRVLGDSTVTVKVGDFQRCCGDDTPVLWQIRGYRWNGQTFRQVSGPTAFPVNPSVTETGVTADDLVFGPVGNDGWRHGTLTVTVSYLRGARPDHLQLVFYVPTDIQRDGSAWPPVNNDYGGFYVQLPTPATGAPARYTYAFKRPASGTGGEFHVDLIGMTAGGDQLHESSGLNNSRAVVMRIAD
jgi:hypothetical protein